MYSNNWHLKTKRPKKHQEWMKSNEVNYQSMLYSRKLFLDPSRIWKYGGMEKATLHDFLSCGQPERYCHPSGNIHAMHW